MRISNVAAGGVQSAKREQVLQLLYPQNVCRTIHWMKPDQWATWKTASRLSDLKIVVDEALLWKEPDEIASLIIDALEQSNEAVSASIAGEEAREPKVRVALPQLTQAMVGKPPKPKPTISAEERAARPQMPTRRTPIAPRLTNDAKRPQDKARRRAAIERALANKPPVEEETIGGPFIPIERVREVARAIANAPRRYKSDQPKAQSFKLEMTTMNDVATTTLEDLMTEYLMLDQKKKSILEEIARRSSASVKVPPHFGLERKTVSTKEKAAPGVRLECKGCHKSRELKWGYCEVCRAKNKEGGGKTAGGKWPCPECGTMRHHSSAKCSNCGYSNKQKAVANLKVNL